MAGEARVGNPCWGNWVIGVPLMMRRKEKGDAIEGGSGSGCGDLFSVISDNTPRGTP